MRDLMREVILKKGVLVLVEEESSYSNAKPGSWILRESLLICLSDLFRLTAYETATLINTQLLYYALPPMNFANISNWIYQKSRIIQVHYIYIYIYNSMRIHFLNTSVFAGAVRFY